MSNMKISSQNVAAIGLGSMGYGIAASALRGGHKVWGVDINLATMMRFVNHGGRAGTMSAAASK